MTSINLTHTVTAVVRAEASLGKRAMTNEERNRLATDISDAIESVGVIEASTRMKVGGHTSLVWFVEDVLSSYGLARALEAVADAWWVDTITLTTQLAADTERIAYSNTSPATETFQQYLDDALGATA